MAILKVCCIVIVAIEIIGSLISIGRNREGLFEIITTLILTVPILAYLLLT